MERKRKLFSVYGLAMLFGCIACLVGGSTAIVKAWVNLSQATESVELKLDTEIETELISTSGSFNIATYSNEDYLVNEKGQQVDILTYTYRFTANQTSKLYVDDMELDKGLPFYNALVVRVNNIPFPYYMGKENTNYNFSVATLDTSEDISIELFVDGTSEYCTDEYFTSDAVQLTMKFRVEEV